MRATKRACLPVGASAATGDASDEHQDALLYLAGVQQEASALPEAVVSAALRQRSDDGAFSGTAVAPPGEPVLPPLDWEHEYLEGFESDKGIFLQLVREEITEEEENDGIRVPHPNDSQAWCRHCLGNRAFRSGAPDKQKLPQAPLVSTLKKFNQWHVETLVDRLVDWVVDESVQPLSIHYFQWLFALLNVLDTPVTLGVSSQLQLLARRLADQLDQTGGENRQSILLILLVIAKHYNQSGVYALFREAAASATTCSGVPATHSE